MYTGKDSGITPFSNAFVTFWTIDCKISLNPICFVFLLTSKILNLSFGSSLCFLLLIFLTFVESSITFPKISYSSSSKDFNSFSSAFKSLKAFSISSGNMLFVFILFNTSIRFVVAIYTLSVSFLSKFFLCILSNFLPNSSKSSS